MSYGFTMDGRDFPCLDEGLPRKYRKMICNILHIGCQEKDKINFNEPELFFIEPLTGNIATWKFYSDKYEYEVKRGERKGMDCWVYQKELCELLFTFQFTEAERVIQKFKEFCVEEMEDTDDFTVYSHSTGEEQAIDCKTDGGYLQKANFFRDFIKDYEDHLSFYKENIAPRVLTESIVKKTMIFIKDRL
jgi:hypothetical protein